MPTETALPGETLSETARRTIRAAYDLAYALRYAFDPELLEHVADDIACGDDCSYAWRESDTNATGCTRSESAEGCPFERASDLREMATAIRLQVWTLAFTPRPDREELLDTISSALSDSLDIDWTTTTGARYVLEALIKEGLVQVAV